MFRLSLQETPLDPLRFLVVDAYPAEGREQLRSAGASEAGPLYRRTLLRLEPHAEVDIVHPADLDAPLPDERAIARYHGIAWTGSALSLTRPDDPRVRRQLRFARSGLEAGVPGFGSCWGAQIAAVAAGGACAASPRGREFGVSRKILLSAEGHGHPLFRGRREVFDALTSHADEVTKLPAGAILLASNPFSHVQAFSVAHARGTFWAVQYHPEYDLREVARICRVRADELVRQGTFRDFEAADAWMNDLEALHDDPSRDDLAWRLGIDADILDFDTRTGEIRNWIDLQVRPRAQR